MGSYKVVQCYNREPHLGHNWVAKYEEHETEEVHCKGIGDVISLPGMYQPNTVSRLDTQPRAESVETVHYLDVNTQIWRGNDKRVWKRSRQSFNHPWREWILQ